MLILFKRQPPPSPPHPPVSPRPSLGSHRCIYRRAFRADVSMSVHGTPVNNVLNPRARARAEIPQPSRPAFFLHIPRVRKHTPGRAGGGAEFSLSGRFFGGSRYLLYDHSDCECRQGRRLRRSGRSIGFDDIQHVDI